MESSEAIPGLRRLRGCFRKTNIGLVLLFYPSRQLLETLGLRMDICSKDRTMTSLGEVTVYREIAMPIYRLERLGTGAKPREGDFQI